MPGVRRQTSPKPLFPLKTPTLSLIYDRSVVAPPLAAVSINREERGIHCCFYGRARMKTTLRLMIGRRRRSTACRTARAAVVSAARPMGFPAGGPSACAVRRGPACEHGKGKRARAAREAGGHRGNPVPYVPAPRELSCFPASGVVFCISVSSDWAVFFFAASRRIACFFPCLHSWVFGCWGEVFSCQILPFLGLVLVIQLVHLLVPRDTVGAHHVHGKRMLEMFPH